MRTNTHWRDILGGRILSALPKAALGLSLAGGMALAPVSAHAADGDFFQNIMGAIGLVNEEKPDIKYRERAPLVIPPSTVATTLPSPKAGAEATNPNWPKDPDVLRARAANSEDRTPVGLNGIDQRGNPLLPSQLNNVRHKPTASATSGGPVGAGQRGRDELMPSELGFTGWFKGMNGAFGDEKPIAFNGEPERESLTAPPPGYQTPAPNAPYGVVEKKQDTWKLPSLFDMHQ